MPEPNNQNTLSNPVGRFMVAVGAIIENEATHQILLLKRSESLDWKPGDWETMYGRIAQHEDPAEGLKREIREETGINDLNIYQPLTAWHIYRGSKSVENDLIGITYLASTPTQQITISNEHTEYRWEDPETALSMVSMPGIQRDIKAFIQTKNHKNIIGKQVIGVGVGALIFNQQNEILLTLRGKKAKNEVGKWEIPGGSVEFGETTKEALIREIKEELNIEIEVGEMLQLCDHIISAEHQHWLSPTYICTIKSGIPTNMEPDKCDSIGWFSLNDALQLPLSIVTQEDLRILLEMQK